MAPDITTLSNGTNGVTGTRQVNGLTNGINGSHHVNSTTNGTNGYTNSLNNGSQRHIQPSTTRGDPDAIAIVGMAMRLPGGIHSSEDFWNLLMEKRDGRIRVPEDRFNVEGFYNPSGKPGTIKLMEGNFLQQNLAHVDTSFFSMTRTETEKLDPQARLLLEVTRELLENAGETKWRGKNIGCYVGVFGEDWQDIHVKDTQDAGMYRITGYGDFLLGNRISYEYDIKGPSMTIKTGCSSSLIALHTAVQAIKGGECPAAIVAGTNLILSPTTTIAMSEQGVLSNDSRCKTFDAKANGYSRGEAINAIYIKRLGDALRDGNPIQAIIRSTASNGDGKTPGISHPSSESHEALFRKAHVAAGLKDYTETAFVECHGTGTAIGDPLETTAVANVFGKNKVYIGSHKPNVGHSEGASGITGVIKAVLALQNKTIPPNINFSEENPKIQFDKLMVPTEAIPWPQDRVERVCVNSFGLGGANATAVIESAAFHGVETLRSPPAITELDRKSQLLVFSANHTDSLNRQVDQVKKYIEKRPENLGDLAYTLGARREHLSYRTAIVTDGENFVEAPAAVKPNAEPTLNFVFTGQGAQWLGMGKELIQDCPSVLKDIREMDKVLKFLPHKPEWRIETELLSMAEEVSDAHKDKLTARLGRAEFSQPLCTAVQIAIVNLLRRWNIKPSNVFGHSSGEIAAAYAADILSMRDAIAIAYYRGLATKQQKRLGGMAAIGLGAEQVAPHLTEGVVVACENSPSSVTISGDSDKLETVMASLKEKYPDAFMRALKVEMAYHSHHMREIGNYYEDLLQGIAPKQPTATFYSSVTEQSINDVQAFGPQYWRANLESPVKFLGAAQTLLQENPGEHVFMEIGPHSALQGPLRQIFKAAGSKNSHYASALQRNKNGTDSLLGALGDLFMRNIPIDFTAIQPGQVLTDLPPYPWNHDAEYWDESRLSRDYRLRKFPRHDILGSRITEGTDLAPSWRRMLYLDEVGWIRDHQISSDTVFPAAGYISMAGEAIRQLSGEDEFTIRQLVISTALVVTDARATELSTVLRPVRLTDQLDSIWYEFHIASYNGSSWTKHCAGQICAGFIEDSNVVPSTGSFPRTVEASKWYRAMSNVGLNYGTRFQGIKSINTSTKDHKARGYINANSEYDETHYHIHPSALDSCLQLFSAAAANGLARNLVKMCVPTFIERLSVRKLESSMDMFAHASATPRGTIVGDGAAYADGELVMDMRGLKLNPIGEDDDPRGSDPHAAARAYWAPDFDFLKPQELIKQMRSLEHRQMYFPVEKLALLCMIENSHQLSQVPLTQNYLDQFRSWLDMVSTRAQEGNYELIDDCKELYNLSSEERVAQIYKLEEQILATGAETAAVAIMRIFRSIGDILKGEEDPVQLLFKDNVMVKLYNLGDLWDISAFSKALGHTKPWLRILEIGAGTGGTTARVLEHLVSKDGERMYGQYVYTDISPGFFAPAKDRFDNYGKMEYQVLDITKDPIEQGFDANGYDMIVAANVLHATPSLKDTLTNVHRLLKPDGQLYLEELCPTHNWLNYIMGTLSGWWLGSDDNRPLEPYVSPERWTEELVAAGFSKPSAVVYDDQLPYQANALIIASPAPKLEEEVVKAISLLCSSRDSVEVKCLETALQQAGYRVDFCDMNAEEPPLHDIISVLDLEKPFFDDISEEDYKRFFTFVQKLKSTGMLWLTGASQVNCKNPRYAQALGIARTIRNELDVEMATLELDVLNDKSLDAIIKVLQKFQRHDRSGEYDPDYEWALNDGVIAVPRFHWFSVNEALGQQNSEEDAPRRLEIGTRGLLNTLQWVKRNRFELSGSQVEVEVRAVGMNFKDLLIAQGIVEGHPSEGNGLGCECAGIVTRVGPEVDNLVPGDRVAVFAGGSYSTSLVTLSQLCAKIPRTLSFKEAATMPCVYSTVIHSLLHLGRLRKGMSVLIQSACGGIGLAAIQVCQMIGATIYATVGNQDKVKYLVENHGINEENIFNSRDVSFLQGILDATNGRGVDIVLNSLSGELLHESWKCVAKYGCMVEIGKRDFIGRGKLSMDVFESNRAFFGVDFAEICAERPDITQSVLEETMELCKRGVIGPIDPVTEFSATQIEEAFRFMQKGTHIGKVVVTIPEDTTHLPLATKKEQLSVKPDASYLLVGGLGGLGQSISTWMVENGARELIYLSRTGGQTPENQAFFKELESLGCEVKAVAGSVTNKEDIAKAISLASQPLAGVLQMSMVLRDGQLSEMSYEDWRTVVDPKVQGTWNLHEATKELPLDFFVLFSSLSGLIGQRGQTNYASANTFLNAFTQYRQSLGLAASVLDICVIEDVGYVSRNRPILDQFKATHLYALQEPELLDCLQMAMSPSKPSNISTGWSSHAQTAIGLRQTIPSTAAGNRCVWRRDIRASIYRNIESTDAGSQSNADQGLKQFLSSVESNRELLLEQEAIEFLATQTGTTLCSYLLMPEEDLDITAPIANFGVDSLVAIELRNWTRHRLGVEMTVLEIMQVETLEAFGKTVAQRLYAKYGGDEDHVRQAFAAMKAP